jgi:putative ABC transport system permease protein
MISFAIKTLLSNRSKLFTGVAGVIFSLVLVNIQGGLYLGLMKKASLLVDHNEADLWVTHKLVENVDLAREIPESWQQRIRGLPTVQKAVPYLVGKGTASLNSGHMEDVWVIGSEPDSMLGSAWGFVAGSRADLRRPYGVSFDEVDSEKLGHPQIGEWLEVNGQRTRIVARTNGITGFITMPYLFTTYNTARNLVHMPSGLTSFILVKIRPGKDRIALQQLIQQRIPDACVYLPEEFASISQKYWMKRTGIGISFGAATLLGLLVGLTVVGQSLYAMAIDHLKDYATLKAIGARDSDVCSVILTQTIWIATVGTFLGMLVVYLIANFWNSPLAPVYIRPLLSAASVVVMFVICIVAAFVPYLRIRKIDPATVLIG